MAWIVELRVRPAGTHTLLEAGDEHPTGAARAACRREDAGKVGARHVQEDGVREHGIVGSAEVVSPHVEHARGMTARPQRLHERDGAIRAIDHEAGGFERRGIPSGGAAQLEHMSAGRHQREQVVDERRRIG